MPNLTNHYKMKLACQLYQQLINDGSTPDEAQAMIDGVNEADLLDLMFPPQVRTTESFEFTKEDR